MSYYGETESRLIGQSGVTRALYETILTAHIAGERVYIDDVPSKLRWLWYGRRFTIQFQVTIQT